MDNNNNLSKFMKCLKQVYAKNINTKYQRIGHLFNDRYKSKPIMSELYIFIVFRYILLNPEKAEICNFDDYKWSSYQQIYNQKSFISINHIEKVFGNVKDIKKIIKLNAEDIISYSEDPISDYEIKEDLKKKLE